eukprot:929725_1
MYITHSITLIMSIRCYGQPFICGQLWIIFMHGQPLHILSLHSLIWWAADVQFVRVQHAWNNGTEQQRKALHRLFVRESALNGGHIDWARYVGDFREPQSVNQVLRAEWNDYTVQI